MVFSAVAASALFLSALAWSSAPSIAARPSAEFASQLRRVGGGYHHDVYELRFPSPVISRFTPNNTVWGHLYVPRHTRGRPACVLLLPVMAAPNLWIERRFVYELLLRRYAVLLLEMPFQFHRVPHPGVLSGQVFLARTAKALSFNFAQSVLDARRAIGWLKSCDLVDGARVGLFGISLGALVGASALSVDERLEGGVLLLGGADFPDLVFNSEMTRDFVRRSGVGLGEIRRAWNGLDPLDYASRNKGKKVFLLNTREDLVIPIANALKLKEAFPDSSQHWLPLGHYTALLHLAWIPGYVSWLMGKILL